MKKIVLTTAAMLAFGTAAYADMKVALSGGWDGKKSQQGSIASCMAAKAQRRP